MAGNRIIGEVKGKPSNIGGFLQMVPSINFFGTSELMGCQVIVGGFPYSVHDFWRGRSEVGHPRSCQDKIDRSHAHTICTYTYVCIYIWLHT